MINGLCFWGFLPYSSVFPSCVLLGSSIENWFMQPREHLHTHLQKSRWKMKEETDWNPLFSIFVYFLFMVPLKLWIKQNSFFNNFTHGIYLVILLHKQADVLSNRKKFYSGDKSISLIKELLVETDLCFRERRISKIWNITWNVNKEICSNIKSITSRSSWFE